MESAEEEEEEEEEGGGGGEEEEEEGGGGEGKEEEEGNRILRNVGVTRLRHCAISQKTSILSRCFRKIAKSYY